MKSFIILSILVLWAVVPPVPTSHSHSMKRRDTESTLEKIIKEEVVNVNDTIYRHIIFKFFNSNPKDTNIVFTQNWNFCFYQEGGIKLDDQSKLLYIYAKGRVFPENLIIFTRKDDYQLQHYTYNALDWFEGDYNTFCISSHFRKLCGQDTITVDFWSSDEDVIDRYRIGENINVRIFTLGHKSVPDSLWANVPLYTRKGLRLYIKNPARCIKNYFYIGHTYEQIAIPTDCEKRYKTHRSWWL